MKQALIIKIDWFFNHFIEMLPPLSHPKHHVLLSVLLIWWMAGMVYCSRSHYITFVNLLKYCKID